MNGIALILREQLEATNMTVGMVLPTLTREQANFRGRGGKGGSIAWHMGHLLGYRIAMLAMLGEERDDPYREKFGYPSVATDGLDYPTPEELMSRWDELHRAILSRLEETTEEFMVTPAQGPMGEREPYKNFSFFAFHEAYHWGSMGTLLAEQGLPTPSDRVMAAMQAGGEDA